MIKNNTRSFLLFTLFLLAATFIGGNAFAQKSEKPDTLDYVQPFSKSNAFRSWSVGINGGVTMPFNEDYTKAGYQPAYGGFIKKQIISTVGIQADFLAGKNAGQ